MFLRNNILFFCISFLLWRVKVAEMHGELMEFNSRLHRTLNFKSLQVEKLRTELTELRGPLPPELTQEGPGADDPAPSAHPELPHSLIHIWIPSVFMRSGHADSFHVYQVR
jgi:sorting nexin-29